VLTAAQRRARGEDRKNAAAERRRLALEDFRAAQAEEREEKRREKNETRGARRGLAFDREGVLAAQREDFFRNSVGGRGGSGGDFDSVLASKPAGDWRERFTQRGGRGGDAGGGEFNLHRNYPPTPVDVDLRSLNAHDMSFAEALGHLPSPRGSRGPIGGGGGGEGLGGGSQSRAASSRAQSRGGEMVGMQNSLPRGIVPSIARRDGLPVFTS